jgi:putative ABC transport system permease protein
VSIPLSYNLRNLRLRWRSTLATMVGIALVVVVFIFVRALAHGMESTYVNTGDERNLIVLRKGSTAESSSQISREEARRIKYLEGIARDEHGEPLASAEIIVLIVLDRTGGGGSANVLVRGISPVALALRPQIRITEGRMLRSGLHECIVSRRIAERFAHCRVGESFQSGKTTWHVVGIFDARQTAYESEIWVNADEARSVFRRDFYGSVLVRPVSPAAETLKQRMLGDRLLNIKVLAETEYYREQTQSAGLFQFLAWFLAIIMTIGAAFAAMNTMYAAVGSRTREIGTLRVLGFRRRQIYASFLLESVMLSLLGGALGCVISLFCNLLSTGTFSQTTFAEVAFQFRVTPRMMGAGMLFALVMGVLGGLLPARMAARKPVLDALRAV